MKNNHETNTDDATIQNIPGPPVPSYHNSSWKLISQGAEARIWLVPNFIQYDTTISSTTNSTSGGVKGINDKSPNIIPTSTNSNDFHVNTNRNMRVTSAVICKERFPKTYRHPILDETLTKSRTKAEAKNLTRCRRGGVSVPLILGVDLNTAGKKAVEICIAKNDGESHDAKGKGTTKTTTNSACLFMEYISGCTVRSFLNVPITQSQQQHRQQDQNEEEEEEKEPCAKKQRLSESETKSTKYVTRLDEYATKVAYQIGVIVAKMHNVNIVHGDLTTSNMILRNSSSVPINTVADAATTSSTTTTTNSQEEWTPDIVLIDFGLSSTSMSTKKTSSHEERAVDLYVLERSFVTTHVGSEELVKEIMRGYKATCQSGDSVFVRLAQVRLRGRKRECFG
mmetsp:Transcript_4768/g.9108  ORF Transcript_4768/g.9108 Transcript_4768/m.9108 type:complete len:396 (-) Transcript_4768:115-1302(-)